MTTSDAAAAASRSLSSTSCRSMSCVGSRSVRWIAHGHSVRTAPLGVDPDLVEEAGELAEIVVRQVARPTAGLADELFELLLRARAENGATDEMVGEDE